ncbi:MFS transporter [Fodinicurvata sediminis]|uniref:MFS transporter n=1 Tax=Fodinicurvata sediminis TaxID=1121832 RepID=UPI0003B774DC|nr:MFS transporter [Fodinicurvata sediminis]
MRQAWWRDPLIALIAAAVILSLSMGLRQTFGLFIEPLHLSTGTSVSGISLSIALQNLLWGAATPFVGMLADRYGTGRCLVGGGLLYSAGLVMLAFADSPLMVHLGGGLLVGLAVAATGFPLVLAAVARVAPEEKRSTWLGIASAGGSAGQFLLLPATQTSINSFGGSMTFLLMAALAFIMVFSAAALAGRPEQQIGIDSQSLSAAITEASKHNGFLLLTAGFFVCGFHVAFIATHLPGYIVSCNLPAFTGATALGIIGFFNIIGSMGAGTLGGRFRKKYLLSGIYLARSLIIGLFMIAPKTEPVVWAFSAGFGLLWLSTVPLTSGLVGQIFGPRYMATLFGIVMFSHQVGAFFGAWLGGLSVDYTGGYDAVWIISILLGLFAAALHWPIADRPVARLAAGKAGG